MRCVIFNQEIPDIITYASELYKFLGDFTEDEVERVAIVVRFVLACAAGFNYTEIKELTIGDYDGFGFRGKQLPPKINELIESYIAIARVVLLRDNLLEREINAYSLLIRKNKKTDRYFPLPGSIKEMSAFRYASYSIESYVSFYRLLHGQTGRITISTSTNADKFMRRVQINKHFERSYPRLSAVSFLDKVTMCFIVKEVEIGMYLVFTYQRKYLLVGIGNIITHGKDIMQWLISRNEEKILSWLQDAADRAIISRQVFDELKTFSKTDLINALAVDKETS